MTLKTYRARSMGDALAEVKKDLGRDAVILHTRTYRVGGLLGFGGKPMVEITASDGVNIASPKPRRNAERMDSGLRGDGAAALRAYGAAMPSGGDGGGVAVATRTAMESVTTAIAAEVRCASNVITSPSIDAELAAIKRMVGHVLQCSRHTALRLGPDSAAAPSGAPISMPDALSQMYLRLIEQEVSAEIADELVARVRDELSAAELGDGVIVRQTLMRHLSELIPAETDTPKPTRGRDGRPLTIALVGPTGVGKTTTVAKLAASYKLRHGRKVGLVTTDTYRIAAVDQLRTYAEIIGLPLKVAMSPTEMGSVCESLIDCDVILIDTAGRSQRDAGRLDELRQFVAAAKPHQTHLVLSSAASQSVLLEAAQRFSQVTPDRVIFTKLDEAVNFGVLVSVARKVSLKLSYVTTGQEVPDHIEAGRPDRIARLLIEGAVTT
jgi:flagellar biosynthesis protein FlhF